MPLFLSTKKCSHVEVAEYPRRIQVKWEQRGPAAASWCEPVLWLAAMLASRVVESELPDADFYCPGRPRAYLLEEEYESDSETYRHRYIITSSAQDNRLYVHRHRYIYFGG